VIPTLLLSYGAATSSFEYMAQQEQRGEQELQVSPWATAYFARLGYIVMMLMVLTGRVTLIDVTLAFGAVMILCAILQLAGAPSEAPSPDAMV
jgi:4-amino-4-deoxy-L-arabinose transferase-like glycosyltransferase